jgi:hypothetical protein
MALRILVAIELVDGALGGVTRGPGVVRRASSLLLLLLLLEISVLRWTSHYELCNILAVCKIGCGVTRCACRKPFDCLRGVGSRRDDEAHAL